MWFNKKLTAFQQSLERLKARVDDQEDRISKELTDNKRNLLEFADLSNKTRRLYLRLTRLTKIDKEESSDVPGASEPESGLDARGIRDSIEAKMVN